MSYLDLVRGLTEDSAAKAPKVAKKAKEVPLPVCGECGDAIGPSEPECWWGLDRVHLSCGQAAWARAWRPEVPQPAMQETKQ